jgi:hypothetical protein
VIKFKLFDESTVLLVRDRFHVIISGLRRRGMRVVAVSGVTFDRLLDDLQKHSGSVPIYIRVFDDGSVNQATSVKQRAFDCFIGDKAEHHLDAALGGGYHGINGAGNHVFGSNIHIYQGSLPLHECTVEVETAAPQFSFAVSIYLVPRALNVL